MMNKKCIPHIMTVSGLLILGFLGLACATTPDTKKLVFSDFGFGDFGCVILSDGTVGIKEYRGKGGNVVIPSEIKSQPVTDISFVAFRNSQLTSVTIPQGVTSIGFEAFANNQLTSVTIPESVTSIGDSAFANNQLTSVTIPESITEIERWAFGKNQLTSVTIPESVTKIGDSAFSNNQLTSVTIPQGVTDISHYAFANNQLTSVTIPESVTSIGYAAFGFNPLTTITIAGTIKWYDIGSYAFGDKAAEALLGQETLSGVYTRQGEEWYRNGEPLPHAVILLAGDGVLLITVDGNVVSSKKTFVPPGLHTIMVAYSKTTGNQRIYTEKGVNFEHRYLFEGGTYLFTAEDRGDKIYFGMKRQSE